MYNKWIINLNAARNSLFKCAMDYMKRYETEEWDCKSCDQKEMI